MRRCNRSASMLSCHLLLAPIRGLELSGEVALAYDFAY